MINGRGKKGAGEGKIEEMQGETNERIKKRRHENVIKVRKGKDARKKSNGK